MRLYIIDGTSIVYRAFHAIPDLRNSKGLPTNAVYGFIQTIRKILRDFNPVYMAIAFDVKGPTMRHEKFTQYKAQRPPMPDLLVPQLPYIKEFLAALNIPVLEKESYEADDIIATVVKMASSVGFKTCVITADKDIYQLVDANTVILDYLTGEESGTEEVMEKFGVGPGQIADLIGLAGDSTDNIPGVPGIGLKTAVKLLKEYGSIDHIFSNIEAISGERLRGNLKKHRDDALLSRELARLHAEVPIELDLEAVKLGKTDHETLIRLLKELEFEKMLKEAAGEYAKSSPKVAPEGYISIKDESQIKSLVQEIRKQKRTSITLFLSDEEFLRAALYGLSVAFTEDRAFFMTSGAIQGNIVTPDNIRDFIKTILEDDSIIKDTDNAKSLYLYALKNGVRLKNIGMDISIASYLLDPSRASHTVEALSYELLGGMPEDFSIRGEGGGGGEDDLIKACGKAIKIKALAHLLDKKLEDERLKALYLSLELPLTEVLASMEIAGVRVDPDILKNLSKEISVLIEDIERSVYALAGGVFNINSPKQLSKVLFEDLRLKPIKKTKTGYSTGEEVLTELAKVHELPDRILNYRQLAKLKSTYIDSLVALINPDTGRIHTSFNQTVTATGRLSSSRPNLQNIPVRGEWALRIREAFVAEKGFVLFSADYSQIELRIVAHMASDPALIDAFKKDEDIHARTACEVFGLKSPSDVTPEQRRRAKAINFGIIYGMGPYGLSLELGIPVEEAEAYITSYFNHYRSVKEFIERTIVQARSIGYTTTLFGRRRFIPELKGDVEANVRLGERLAVNTPIQGTAADIIKAAMIRIHRRMRDEGLRSRMIIQIHDELVFEAFKGELELLSAVVKEEMEGAVRLSVPVKVNMKFGADWRSVE